jgi:hypothetical protein
MVSLGAWQMTLADNTVYPCGSIDTNFDPAWFPLDSTFNRRKIRNFSKKDWECLKIFKSDIAQCIS